jgi:hypothetical protein
MFDWQLQFTNILRKNLLKYMNEVEPQLVVNRQQCHLRRKRYYAAGLMEVWTIDQHDK